MDISIFGKSDQYTSYIILTPNDKTIKLIDNHKFSLDINRNNYFKIIFHTPSDHRHISNFLHLQQNDTTYPLIFNPAWNCIPKENNLYYSENIFVNLKNYNFQKIDNIDKINQLNCLCSDLTRPYFLPQVNITIADRYCFIFDDWIGNNQIWLSSYNKSFASILLGKEICYFTCSLRLPEECGDQIYDFYSEYFHDTPYDELGRIDCFSLRPEFSTIKPINFPILFDDSCSLDINNFSQQLTINTYYKDV